MIYPNLEVALLRRAAWLLLGACYGLSLIFGAEANGGRSEVTSFHEFYLLSPQAASNGAPVKLRGVILCYDLGWNQLYVHDGTETAWLSPKLFQTNLQAGAEVEISGFTTFGQGGLGFTNLQLKVLGAGKVPAPKDLEMSQLGSDFGQWVQTGGRVRVAEASSDRLGLILQAKGKTCLVYVMGTLKTNDFKWLVGCDVKIRGINGSKIAGNRLESASLTAPDMGAVTVLRRSDLNPEETPLASIENLVTRKLGAWTNEPVRVSGTILAYKPGELLTLRDATGVIKARVIQTTEARDGDRVDVRGFLAVVKGEAILMDSYFEAPRHQGAAYPRATLESESGQAGVEAITESAEISRMSRDKAKRGLPVRLKGVITYADPAWQTGFLQDQSGAVFVAIKQEGITAGQFVEATGRTSPGGFAPEVIETTFKILGTTNLPPPITADLQDLVNGHLDSHWVQVQGVVRRVAEQWGHVTLTLTTPKGRFKATVLKPENQPTPANLIGALVEVRGACTSEMNSRGQLTGIILYAANFEQVSLLEAVPANPFEAAVERIASVATFDPARLTGRRIKISGQVTMIIPDEGYYVQDESGGIRVTSLPPEDLRLGDSVDVLGFPAMGGFSPCLEEAIVRRLGPNSTPKPLLSTAEEILRHGTNDAFFVKLDGRLVQSVAAAARPKLLLQSGSILFPATLLSPVASKELSKLKAGSLLRIEGVCLIQAGESREPESFRLMISDVHNITVLATPPWWTVQTTLTLVGTAALSAVLLWIWSSSLRRQVKAQTEVIRRNEQQLISISRQAGMAEVATSVLHNVGNVLNSVNVSVQLAANSLRKSKVTSVNRVAGMLKEHSFDLGSFVTNDPRGRGLADYLGNLGEHLTKEQSALLEEMKSLASNIAHINDIVAMQQNYAKVGGVTETVTVAELVEDALRMNQSALLRHEVQVARDYDGKDTPEITVERHKVLQILLNLVSNAKYACSEAGGEQRTLTLGVRDETDKICISCADNGVGIPEENLQRIFNHGFTTRPEGHGFGLHGSALAAREMGGTLLARSAGPGKGATFTLELPRKPKQK